MDDFSLSNKHIYYYLCHVLLSRNNICKIILINIEFNRPYPDRILGRFWVRLANVGLVRVYGPCFRLYLIQAPLKLSNITRINIWIVECSYTSSSFLSPRCFYYHWCIYWYIYIYIIWFLLCGFFNINYRNKIAKKYR